MKIETLNARIENAQSTIEKKESTLARHQKSADKMLKEILAHGWNPEDRYCRQDTEEHHDAYWLICDYQNKLDDIKRTEKAVAEAKSNLEKYQSLKADEVSKANSRDCQVIWDFLNRWEIESISFYLEQREKYLVAQQEYFKADRELTDKFNNRVGQTSEDRKALWKQSNQLRKDFHSKWHYIEQFDVGSKDWETTMKEAVAYEKIRKYDALIEKVSQFCGNITDASGLMVGAKGDLDGVIIGDKGKARVQTIGAGGYNIQRFHYRVLVNPIQ